MPAGTAKLMGHKAFDWCLPTEPDPTIDGRTMQWAAGKALGGRSSINAQVYMSRERSDYDRWYAMVCPGRGYDDIFRSGDRRCGKECVRQGTIRGFLVI